MKKINLTLIIFFLGLFPYINLHGQGCVAIRSFSGCGTGVGGGAILLPGESTAGMNFRYFHSFRHFRGTEEEKERLELGTEVINDSYFADFSYTYAFARRYYASLTIPFVYHERSSMYEHGGNSLGDRHKTYSKGLADIRFAVGHWFLDPKKHPIVNVALAMGLKLPTGDYDAEGKFYNVGPDREMVTRPLDQSIQPGDGGLGLTVETQTFYQVSSKLILNGSFYYLINPKEDNGTRRREGSTPYAAPDQYAARLSMVYATPLNGLGLSVGGRMECVPVYDLIGGSDAYRRPGYAISVEPGLNYQLRNFLLTASIPVAIERNRTQSYLDKKRERETGEPRHGDAAFADYLINVGVVYRFHKMNQVSNIFNANQ
ncbi:transporter [Fulvivirga sp. 29W222]|uniref:Transporter n=1 Tax=Fulvivirga marina TaxID=2494733 RepID=A0A937KG56_9BACT|nr:transporter [Fulvivirga marina]MBL6448848.1 transporter [Fulvivirga marina]